MAASLKAELWRGDLGACFDKDVHGEWVTTLVHNNMRAMWHGVFDQVRRCAGRREPFNFTPTGVNSLSFGSPHVRCTPMGRTCAAKHYRSFSRGMAQQPGGGVSPEPVCRRGRACRGYRAVCEWQPRHTCGLLNTAWCPTPFDLVTRCGKAKY